MILRYERLSGVANVFRAMTGMSLADFDELVEEITPVLEESERLRRNRSSRRRAIGGGHPFELSPRDQILLTVVWLRHRPTHEVLAYLFGISKPTAARVIARILPLLESPRMGDGGSTATSAITKLWRRGPKSGRSWQLSG